MARLETVEEPAGEGDFVVMDFQGTIDGEAFAGGEGRDQLIELGSRQPRARLRGAAARRRAPATSARSRSPSPTTTAPRTCAGRTAEFAVTVKEVKRKQLPELDDDFASDAAGFDTLDELREDIATRMREADEQRVEAEFREAVLDAVVARGDGRGARGAGRGARARAVGPHAALARPPGHHRDTYLRIAGKSEEEILDEARPDAEQALRREAVIAAVIEAEGIEPVRRRRARRAAGDRRAREHDAREAAQAPARRPGRLDELRDDLAQRQAVDLLAERAKPISVEQAQARDKLWTPGKERAARARRRTAAVDPWLVTPRRRLRDRADAASGPRKGGW